MFETSRGKRPFVDWLNSLGDSRARSIIRARLNRIELGNFVDCKSVGKGVLELRVFYGSGHRIYFGRQGEAIVILLSGGDKSSQKRDIKQAQTYWKEYQDANI